MYQSAGEYNPRFDVRIRIQTAIIFPGESGILDFNPFGT